MSPKCGNTILKHKKDYEQVFIKELCNSQKVRKIVAIYKTIRLVFSNKEISLKIKGLQKKYLTQKVILAGANFPFKRDAHRHFQKNKVQ